MVDARELSWSNLVLHGRLMPIWISNATLVWPAETTMRPKPYAYGQICRWNIGDWRWLRNTACQNCTNLIQTSWFLLTRQRIFGCTCGYWRDAMTCCCSKEVQRWRSCIYSSPCVNFGLTSSSQKSGRFTCRPRKRFINSPPFFVDSAFFFRRKKTNLNRPLFWDDEVGPLSNAFCAEEQCIRQDGSQPREDKGW